MKLCTGCDELRPSADFHRRADQADGLATRCRACDSKAGRERRQRYAARPAVGLPEVKRCPHCETTRPATEFHKSRVSKDGLAVWCADCAKARHREHAATLARRAAIPTPAEKQCSRCDLVKPASDFYRNASAVHGLTSACRACVSARRRDLAAARSDAAAAEKRAADAAYYEANRERIKGRVAGWQRANPDRRLVYAHRRRARKRRVESDVTVESRQALFDSYCGLCAYCHAPADTLDHIDPLFYGGADVLANLVPACRSCNGRKHTRPLLRWLMDMAA